MAGYHCHQRMFGAELWTDPWLSENSNRREVMRAVIQLADGFGKFYNGSDLANRIKIMFFPIVVEVSADRPVEARTKQHTRLSSAWSHLQGGNESHRDAPERRSGCRRIQARTQAPTQ